jgi:hypothetical protein
LSREKSLPLTKQGAWIYEPFKVDFMSGCIHPKSIQGLDKGDSHLFPSEMLCELGK